MRLIGKMKFILTKQGVSAETEKVRRRLIVEKQWVQSLLQICRRKVDPDDFHRWQEKYEDDCRWLRKCDVAGHP